MSCKVIHVSSPHNTDEITNFFPTYLLSLPNCFLLFSHWNYAVLSNCQVITHLNSFVLTFLSWRALLPDF